MYIKKIYDLGEYKEIHKYYRYGCPKGKRGRKHDRTSETVIRYNQKLKERQLQRILCANFKEGDWHLVLSYRKEDRPGSMEEAKKDLRNFLRKLKNRFRKAGHELKYICATERGKQGACHHHLIVEDIADGTFSTKQAVVDLWKGARHFTPLYDQDAYMQLAEYIAKKDTKEGTAGISYSRSRNLIVPRAKVKRIGAREWSREPKNEKYYEVIKGTVEEGENPYTGMPYMRYLMKRTGHPDRREKKEKRNK